jgi:sulfate adenylyltransferase
MMAEMIKSSYDINMIDRHHPSDFEDQEYCPKPIIMTGDSLMVLLKYKGENVAVLDAEEVWKPNKVKEAAASFGTTSTEHPSVQELFADLGQFYVGGKVHGLTEGFEGIWGAGFKTPAEVRATLPADKSVVAFQNRNPVHKAHFELPGQILG